MIILKSIKLSLYKLKCHFTVRAFLKLFAGLALLFANFYFYFASVIYAFRHYPFATTIIGITFGTIGFVISCFMIFFLSVYYAANPDYSKSMTAVGGTFLREALADKSKNRQKKIILAISLYIVIWLVAIGTLSYYFYDKIKYADYVETKATIKVFSTNEDEVSCTYNFSVNGTNYTVRGTVKYSGDSIPASGDTVIIKYNPDNPEDVYISSEKIFFLGFGSFFLYCGILLVIVEIKRLPVCFLLAYITIGLTAVAFLVSLTGFQPNGIVDFFAHALWTHFVLIFGNIGIIMLLNGFIGLIPEKK